MISKLKILMGKQLKLTNLALEKTMKMDQATMMRVLSMMKSMRVKKMMLVDHRLLLKLEIGLTIKTLKVETRKFKNPKKNLILEQIRCLI